MKIAIDHRMLQSLLFLAAVIEARDPWTAGHIWRTSRYARLLAEKIGLEQGDVFLTQTGALVHDLGKIGIPDVILNKRGRFSETEIEVMRHHPEIGHRVVANHPLAPLVEDAILEHHLRIDGGGYPAELDDRSPSMISRLVSVVDTFDAVTSARPYGGAKPVVRAVQVLREEAGRQLDGQFSNVMATMAEAGELDHILHHCGENRLLLHCPDCGPIIAPPEDAADGDGVDCPSCASEFVLHFSRSSYELEWKGSRKGIHLPRPDLEAVNEVIRAAPKSVSLPDEDEKRR